MDTQALQLHEKVQKLIEQYTLDKKKLSEMELTLNDKINENETLKENIVRFQNELRTAQENYSKLNQEKNQLVAKNQEMEKMLSTFEGFANDLNSKIDDLIPKIEKL